MIETYLLLGGLSAVICLDRRTALHLMLSRPLVVSILVGLILGDVHMAILYGLIFEIIGLVDVPVGTHIPRDDTFGAYAFTVTAHFVGIANAGPFIAALLGTLVMMTPVTWSELAARRLNRALFMGEVRRRGAGNIRSGALVWKGVVLSLLRGLVIYNLAVVIIIGLMRLLLPFIPRLEMMMLPLLASLVVLLSGFLLRFLSARSWVKYVVFTAGILVGWVIL